MFIQLPILWAVWYVIRSIPAYVGEVKEVYTPLLEGIMATDGWQKIMEGIGKAKPIMMDPSRYDYSDKNIIIDVLYKFQSTTWETLTDKFPALESTINSTMEQLHHMNNFLGLNIAEAPATLIKDGLAVGAFGIVIMAILIPVLAGLTQYISVKLTSQNNTGDPNNQMAATMKSMNIMFPLMSVVMSFTLPTGLGIYWVVSAVVRTVQMVGINKYLDKVPMDELIAQNMEKAAKKRANKKEVEAKNVNQMAHKKAKSLHEPVRTAEEEKALEEKLQAAKAMNENAKEGSLAAKANLVKRFNETKK